MMLNIKRVELTTSISNYMVSNIFVILLLGLEFAVLLSYSLTQSKTHVQETIQFLLVIDISSNLELLGYTLYGFHVFQLIIVALLLFMAMIGSIVITLSHDPFVRRIEVFEQNQRTFQNTLRF
jgi:NADH:ubiquinone oxidoreductase subunit 6 (subunit J)